LPTGAAQVCGVVGVMQFGPASALAPLLPLLLPAAAPLAPADPAPERPDDVPVLAPEEDPLLAPDVAPDRPLDDVPLEVPEPPVDPPDETAPLPLSLPDWAGEPALGEHAATTSDAARQADDNATFVKLISKVSRAQSMRQTSFEPVALGRGPPHPTRAGCARARLARGRASGAAR